MHPVDLAPTYVPMQSTFNTLAIGGTLIAGEMMGRLSDFALKLGRMFSIIGISNPDEVKRKRILYQQQREARLAKQAHAASAETSSATPLPPSSTLPKP